VLTFDFDPDEIVQQPGQGGPIDLRSAVLRLPAGPVAAVTILGRAKGRLPPFFDSTQVEVLRDLMCRK
jgi:hypothetical protein